MQQLLAQIQTTFPFDVDTDTLCDGECRGCKVKLLEYLADQVDTWQYRLAQGDVPDFGDLHKLGKSARKIHRVFEKNN